MNAGNSLKISRILHAGYVLEFGATQIAFDPIFENPFSRNCYAFPNVRFDRGQIRQLEFAAVFISHFHDDHCSLESLNLLSRETPVYLFCVFEELFTLIRQLGFTNVYSLKIDEPVIVGSFAITARKALDEDVDSIFQIQAAGLNILNVVDSWIGPDTLLQLKRRWDMILWPFQTMRELEVLAPSRAAKAALDLPPEWIEQLQILKPRYVVPSSCQFIQEDWSWYNQALFPISYRQFQAQVEAAVPDCRVVRMNPSVSFNLSSNSLEPSAPLPWVQPVGQQDVDYNYREDLKPPSTAEIARRFAPLSVMETERVFGYLRSGLLEKYQALDLAEDVYFSKSRIWRLSVYDHAGAGIHFHYRLDGQTIETVPAGEEPLSWLTEISIAKLHSALECGESLTSLYMRINDMVFLPGIEDEIRCADVVQDPLIRCLFNKIPVGAYQAAQLKELTSGRATLERRPQ